MPALQLYGKLGANVMGGEAGGDSFAIDYLTDNIAASLHTNTYTPNIDTDETFTDATNELTTANGYTAGGQNLGTKTVSYNATGNVTTYSAADFSWTASGGSLVFRYVVIRKNTGTASTSPLIGVLDANAGGNMTLADGNTFTVDITASGLLTATAT